MNRLAKLIVLANALVALSACGRNSSSAPKIPGIDDKPFLEAIGFTQPIETSVQFDRLYNSQGGFLGQDDGAIASVLKRAGYISIVPNANGSPWWSYVTTMGTLTNTVFTLPVAKRVVVGRSDVRTWSEGPIQYYAETVEYSLQLADTIQYAINTTISHYTLRLVLVNDPAAGRWQVLTDPARGTKFDTGDGAAVTSVLAREGRRFFGAWGSAVAIAQGQAYDMIERRMIEQGVLERSKADPHVLMSRSHHLVFYANPTYLSEPLTAVSQACRAVHAAGYEGFRIPTQPEMAAAMDAQGGFLDTPDRRFWTPSTFSAPDPSGPVLFVTNTFSINFNSDTFSLDLDTLSGVQPYSYYYSMHTYEITPADQRGPANVVYDVAGNHPVAARDYSNAHWRVLCVADLKG